MQLPPQLPVAQRLKAAGSVPAKLPMPFGDSPAEAAPAPARPLPASPLPAVASQSQLNSNPIIAAIPLMLLSLLTAAVGGYTFVHRQMMWPYRLGRADVARLEAMASKPALAVANGASASSRVGVLTFENLTVRWARGSWEWCWWGEGQACCCSQQHTACWGIVRLACGAAPHSHTLPATQATLTAALRPIHCSHRFALHAPVCLPPCSVPLRPKEAAKRSEALRRKALQRAHSRTQLGEPHNSGLGRLIEAAKNKLHLPLGGDLERVGSGELAPRTASAAEQAGECGATGGVFPWVGCCQGRGYDLFLCCAWFAVPRIHTCVNGGYSHLCERWFPHRGCKPPAASPPPRHSLLALPSLCSRGGGG